LLRQGAEQSQKLAVSFTIDANFTSPLSTVIATILPFMKVGHGNYPDIEVLKKPEKRQTSV